MAWNEPGGKRRDPWGNGGGNKDQPPDLEEMLNRIKSSFMSLFGGGRRGSGSDGSEGGSSGPGFGAILIVAVIVGVLWAGYNSFHVIDQRQRGVVLRLGEYVRTLEPGLRWTLPKPIEEVFKVNVTQVRSSSDEVSMLTADENLIFIDFAMQYDIKDPVAFMFKVRDPEQSLSEAAESAVRQVVGSRTLDQVLVGARAEITLEALDQMQDLVDLYETGINVRALNFQDVRVPDQVKDAFDDAIKAREDEQRLANEARAYASKVVPEARGRAARILAEAQGYREATIARSKGEAIRFELMVAEYQAAPDVTRRRLALDTLRQVLVRTPKVLMDAEAGSLMYVPLDKLLEQARQGARDNTAVSRREVQ